MQPKKTVDAPPEEGSADAPDAPQRPERRARQQRAVAELGTFALRHLGPGPDGLQRLMDRAVQVVAETLGMEYCKVLELLPGGDAVLLRSGVGWRDGLVGDLRLDTGRDSQAGYTLLSDEPVVVTDLPSETRFSGPELLTEHGVVSGVSCVIAGPTGALWGVLGAHSRLPFVFADDDVDFVQSVANLLGAALQRQQAEDELRRLGESLEARVEERTRQVRDLASRLSKAEQRERARIAQVLHDDVQQLLYALQIQVRFVLGADEPERVRAELANAHELLQRAIAATRSLTVITNPPVLREEGLAAALRWLAAEMSRTYPLEIDARIELAERDPLSVDERALVLHSVRELLFNVVKHAGVERAELLAHVRDGLLEVEVSDRGAGYDLAATSARSFQSFGLATIRERLQLHDGDLTVRTKPGGGMRVVVSLPFGD